MKRQIPNLLIFLAVIVVIPLLTSRLTQTREVDIERADGVADLRAVDLALDVACVHAWNYVFYPNALYCPDDFARGDVAGGDFAWRFSSAERNATPYGTYRTVLSLPAGGVYGFSMSSPDYSQRLFIDGVEQEPVGWPAATREETVPGSSFNTYYAAPRTGEVEIIIQYANFNHREGGGPFPLYVGLHQSITHRYQNTLVRIYIIAGCMLTIFIFYLGMYLFFGMKPHFLSFSLCCLTIGMRVGLTGDKALRLLFPGLSWHAAMALEYLALVGMVVTAASFVDGLFGYVMHRFAKWTLYAVSLAYALLIAFTEPLIYSRYLLAYQLVAGVGGAYLICLMISRLPQIKFEHILIYLGAAVFTLGAIVEIFVHGEGFFFSFVGMTQLGMLIFIFANMMGIAMQFSRAEAELAAARRNERELEDMNRMLDRLSRLKNDFLSDIAHEMKTPLTVMSGFAQLALKEMRRGNFSEDVEQDLSMISTEAGRLALLVSNLLEVNRMRDARIEQTPTDLRSLAEQVVGLYRPVLEKNGNRIEIAAPGGLPLVPVKQDQITQVLLNLLTNANRHTQNGTIRIAIEAQERCIRVTVSDTGSGIPPELLPHVFERFQREGKAATGLGLAICKEIIESHGGQIWAANRPESGAAIAFTLPVQETA